MPAKDKQKTVSPVPVVKKQEAEISYEFVNRILEVPIVNTSVTKVKEIYNEHLENPVTDYVVQKAVSISKPILRTIEPYHQIIDGAGNYAIDTAERVIDVGKSYATGASNTYTSMKGSIEGTLLHNIHSALSVYDAAVDYVLPPTEEEALKQIAEVGTEEVISESPFRKIFVITNKAGKRFFGILTRKTTKITQVNPEILNLHSTLDLLSYFHQHVENSSKKLRDTISSTRKFLLENTKEFVEDKKGVTVETVLAVQNRLIEAVTEFKSNLSGALAVVKTRSIKFPGSLQDRISALTTVLGTKWNETLTLSSNIAEKNVNVDKLLKNLASLTERAGSLVGVSVDGMAVIHSAKDVVVEYYSKAGAKVEDIKSKYLKTRDGNDQ
jgi:hypothetical protein